jgi:hypothetical protein
MNGKWYTTKELSGGKLKKGAVNSIKKAYVFAVPVFVTCARPLDIAIKGVTQILTENDPNQNTEGGGR